jgi:hypothetical protein
VEVKVEKRLAIFVQENLGLVHKLWERCKGRERDQG